MNERVSMGLSLQGEQQHLERGINKILDAMCFVASFERDNPSSGVKMNQTFLEEAVKVRDTLSGLRTKNLVLQVEQAKAERS